MTRDDDSARSPERREAPRPALLVFLGVLAFIVTGAAFALAHATIAWRTTLHGSIHYRGFCAPPELLARDLQTYAPGSCLVQLEDPGWRPLQLAVRLRARRDGQAADAGVSGESPPTPAATNGKATANGNATSAISVTSAARAVQISVNDHPVEQLTLGDAWTARTVDVPPRDRLATTVLLRLETTAAASAGGAPPIEVAPVEVTRVWTRTRTLRTVGVGALAGALAWVAIVPPLRARRRGRLAADDGDERHVEPDEGGRTRRPAESTAASRADVTLAPVGSTPVPLASQVSGGWIGMALVTIGLAAYFGAWGLLRPPYQTPDEVQHHLRTTSVLRHPWIAGAGEWTLDPRFTNPLALWPPASLGKLFFDPDQRLTRQEIAALEAVPWPAADTRPIPEPYQRAIASYPTLYYLALFGVAEPATRMLSLSPYQSTYAYRLVSGLLAALLWAGVYRALRRTQATRDLAGPLVAFLVLNPMVAFMSSAINPDAVNVPLATLAILLLWRVLSGEDGPSHAAPVGAATLALIATAWTKPSGLQVLAAFALAAGALWLLRRVSFARLRLAGAVVIVTGLVAWCGFYAWSPPRFLGGQPVPDTVTTYLAQRWKDAGLTWVQYWGTLGWLEYALPAIWYQLLLAAAIVGLVCTLIRPRPSRLFTAYAALFIVAFLIVTMVGELAYLPTAGYFLQGRHLLPASIGLAVLLLHRMRAVRVAFLVLLIVMNGLLLQATVERYYTRGWSAATAALPFVR